MSGPIAISGQTSSSTPTTSSVSVSSSTTPSSASPPGASVSGSVKPPSDHVDTAALVGGIIGAAVGAALLAFLITSLVCLRRIKSQERSSKRRSRLDRSVLEKPLAAVVKYSWEQYLPQSADDHTVRCAVKTLFDALQLHVENFYSRSPVEISEGIRANLDLVQSTSTNVPVAELFARCASPLPIIKQCMCYAVAASIDPSAHPSQSLLPIGWALPPSSTDPIEPSKPRAAAKRQAICTWRVLTAFLNSDPRNDPAYLAFFDQKIAALVEQFTVAFRPWQKKGQGLDAAQQNLTVVLSNAINVAILLFSQASTFEFRWPSEHEHDVPYTRGAMIVVPEFVKTADEKGEVLRLTQTMIEEVIERV
ncbi:hypothetical protein LTR17_023738 [Elasticomyces elasticus]|nr:hypothetical protein LTR17_023738 [Elasticomyces elasticus]